MERETCRLCGERIAVGHTECPACGYNPRRLMAVLAAVLFLAGAALFPFVGETGFFVSLTGVVLLLWSVVWARPTR